MYKQEELAKSVQTVFEACVAEISNKLRDSIILATELAKKNDVYAGDLVSTLRELADQAEMDVVYIDGQTALLERGEISLGEWMVNVGRKVEG